MADTDEPVADFIDPWLGDKVDSGIRLYLSPQSGSMNLATEYSPWSVTYIKVEKVQ